MAGAYIAESKPEEIVVPLSPKNASTKDVILFARTAGSLESDTKKLSE
jgi:hypothetical protein